MMKVTTKTITLTRNGILAERMNVFIATTKPTTPIGTLVFLESFFSVVCLFLAEAVVNDGDVFYNPLVNIIQPSRQF